MTLSRMMLIGGLLLLAGCVFAGEKAVDLKTRMRLAWPPAAPVVPQSWLVCGEFAVPAAADGEKDAPQPLLGFTNDFLQAHGGEAGIRPVSDMAHKRAAGTPVTWRLYAPAGDTLSFSSAFPVIPFDNVVWYAYTTMPRAKAGKAALAIAAASPVKVWVNGMLVHEHFTPRDGGIDDLIAVDLQAGENAVLVKVLQRTTPGVITVRVLDSAVAQAAEMASGRLNPAIVPVTDGIAVLTDDRRRDFLTEHPPVTIDVLAPGGKPMTQAVAPRGETARFATADWADGPYEIRCTMTVPTGRTVYAYRLWYKGDAKVAAKELAENPPPADDRTPSGMILAMLGEMVLARTTGEAAKTFTEEQLYPILMEAAELNGYGPVMPRPNGFVRLAWRDEVDDSPQFCRVYLPPNYNPATTYPVVVTLHGRADDFPPYVKWGGNDARHDGMADGYGVISVYPHGRGNAWYRGMGDRDVMRCVELVKAQFAVDADRIYLKGYSMGGAGTWYVGTRHPDVFAALAPFFGGYDFRFQLDEASLERLTPKEQFRRERLSYIAQLESLFSTPVFVSHGDLDGIVPVDYSRYTVRMLERWGYPVRYWEAPGKGHGGIGDDEVMKWLLAQRLARNPRRVRLRAAELRSASAHWLAIEQRKDPFAMMQADAEVTAPNCIRLDTINALQVTLSPAPPLIDPTKPVTVVWNGADIRTVMPEDGRVTLRAKGYTPAALCKRPALDGPVNDVFNTPVLLVVGTTATDPLMRAFVARAANRFQAWWNERHHCTLPMVMDTDTTPEQAEGRSLILFGGPGENAVAETIADRLPLKITPYAVTIDGKAFRGRDAAVQMVYPNPLNPDRYVIVRAATSATGMYFSDYVLNDTDFSIVDARNADPARMGKFFDVVTGRNSGPVLAAGYFNNAWKLTDENIERGDVRKNKPVWTLPTRASATGGHEMPLSALVETRASGAFLDLLRDAPMRLGRTRYTHGLYLPAYWLPRQPAWIEYDLGDAGWTRLTGVIGLEGDRPGVLPANTGLVFVVKGDGVELYKSEPCTAATRPKALDLDIAGVTILRLEVLVSGTATVPLRAVDWAEMRLGR